MICFFSTMPIKHKYFTVKINNAQRMKKNEVL